MADSLASAWVEVVPDFKEFRKKTNSEMTGILGTAGDEGGKRAGSGVSSGIVAGVSGALAFGLLEVASGVGRLVGQTIGEGINFALGSIDLASDLNESFNANEVAFGKQIADQLAILGSDAATRLGLTQKSFNEFATQFSSFAQTIRADDVPGFIDELTNRGADFASVYNLEVSDALALFQSGLAGETEPLRKFGIDLSAASVEAFAYANGIGVAGRALTEQEKVQARYGLLLASTSKVQGDNANTAGELAGQQRRLAAAFETAQTKLGTALLPGITALTTLANEKLIPVLNGVIDKVGPILADALTKSAPAFGDLIVAVAPLIPDLVRLSVEALPLLIDALILLAPLLIDQTKNVTSLATVFNGFFSFLSGNSSLADLGADLTRAGGSFTAFAQFAATAILGTVRFFSLLYTEGQAKIGAVVGFFTSLPTQISSAISSLNTRLYSAGRSLFQNFLDGIKTMVKPITNVVDGIMRNIAGFFPNSPAERGPFSGSGWSNLFRSGGALFNQFAGGFESKTLDMNSAVVLPRTSSVDPVSSDGGSTSGSLGSKVEINAIGVDPMTVSQMLYQQFNARMVGV